MKMVEAALLIPLTILITVSLIGLMMDLYERSEEQIRKHAEVRNEYYQTEIDW